MHIPDGYLSPKTCGLFFAAMLPVWYAASRWTMRSPGFKGFPLLALGAAFSFIIMMFNVPIPGGSSGHMTGTVVLGIVLGPWAALIAGSITLALQALLFGDGGILAFGANSFNMALIMSFSGFYVYRALVLGTPGRLRGVVAPAVAGYVAINLCAFAAALELGAQPIIAVDAQGAPLYAPYSLSITVPAMMIPHLLFFGPIEALGTALVLSYVRKQEAQRHEKVAYGAYNGIATLMVGLLVLALLTPIGLIASGTPWGEWSVAELSSLTGFVPAGMARLGEMWPGLAPDYGQANQATPLVKAGYYVLSAIAGSAIIVAAIYLWGRICRR
ncbi:MAG: cobalt transporter CbiM [Deltaproteobacteria bacterium]